MPKSYLYHAVREKLVGDRLMPLNRLRELDQAAYERAAAKYIGRESTMRLVIPRIDCLWNDVLFMTAIHPAKVKALYEQEVGPFPGKRYFKIDAELLTSPCVVWLWDKDDLDRHDSKQYIDFEASRVSDYDVLPNETRLYYQNCAAEGIRPLIWYRTPHILYKGTIPIEGLEIIEI